METLIHFDQQLLLWIQHHCHIGFLDSVMPWMRKKESWFPLYGLIFFLLVIRYRWVGLRIALIAVICVVLSDIISSRVFKPTFKRIRPCADPEISIQYKPLIDCSKGFSFTSSHAANHFAIAFALCLFFYKRKKWLIIPAILWAGSVSFAQVYVGVHYPLDILGGAIIGLILAFSAHWIINKYFAKYFEY